MGHRILAAVLLALACGAGCATGAAPGGAVRPGTAVPIDPADPYAWYARARSLAGTGEAAEALASLRRALDAGFLDVAALLRDPAWQRLRGDDLFEELLREFGAVLEEEREPSPENITRLLAEPRFERFVPRRLPRYRSPLLTKDTLRLLDHADTRFQRAAIVSLLHQNATDPEPRARVTGKLESPTARVREAAAEYFVWHGTEDDREGLSAAAARESDPIVEAALQAALRLIAVRAGWAAAMPSGGAALPTGGDVHRALQHLLATPTAAAVRQATDVYRSAWVVEPTLRYSGAPADPRALAEQHDRFNLTGSLFGFLPPAPRGTRAPSAGVPVAASFVGPVRDYFNPRRRSYGARVGSGGPFANTVHAGDDVAHYQDDGTVVAIADGVVQSVSHTYSWGFIVIIEHRLAKGEGLVCSLYAHLAPSIGVAPGQVVTKGQRIAALGRSFTWENGGYPAHLHFGIHRGPYLQSRPVDETTAVAIDDGVPGVRDASWVTGYLGLRRYASGKHGWVDPQTFIGDRSRVTSPGTRPPS